MRITFAIPFNYMTGGIRSIFELSNALVEKGHQVVVAVPFELHPCGNTLLGKIRRSLMPLFDRAFPYPKEDRIEWFTPKFQTLKVRYLTNDYLPAADYVVATNWRTASWINKLNQSKGEKIYFVFDIETWDRGRFSEDEVMRTYQLIPNLITYSRFVVEELLAKANRLPGGVCTLGVNTQKFYPDPSFGKDNSEIRICMMMHPKIHKGLQDGLNVFEIVREKISNVQFVGFGFQEVEKSLPGYIEFHPSPDDDELRRLYSSCHILLASSRREGFNLPPMEAMACGCAVVATRTGAVSEYAIDKETALLTEVGDVLDMAEKLLYLIQRPKEIRRLAVNALRKISQYTWEHAAFQFEEALKGNFKTQPEFQEELFQ